MSVQIESLDRLALAAGIFESTGGCHYQRASGVRGVESLVPAGASPTLFYLLYPYLLSLSYGGQLPAGWRFRDPQGEVLGARILQDPPLPRDRLRNAIKTLLLPLWATGRVACQPSVQQDGQSFRFDLGSEGTICPAALRAFYPYMLAQLLDPRSGGKGGPWRVCCPDHKINLVLGWGAQEATAQEAICGWGDGVRITPCGPCSAGRALPAGDLESIAAAVGLPCPTLLNTALGYHLTLGTGGKLGFYQRDLQAGIFQCPAPRSRVAVRIRRRGDVMEYRVLAVPGEPCPRGLTRGQGYRLPAQPQRSRACLHAFNALYFYAGLTPLLGGALELGCLLEQCEARFELLQQR